MISRHELELMSLLRDEDLENIRKDICEERGIEYCEKNLAYIDDIIRNAWTAHDIEMMKRDERHERIWKVFSFLVAAVPIGAILSKTIPFSSLKP